MITEQEVTTRLNEVAGLVGLGRQSDAAEICRDILRTWPQNVPTLVWLGFCTTDLNEAYEATARAYHLDPNNSDVLQAINGYNARQAQAAMNAGAGAMVEIPRESVLPPLPAGFFLGGIEAAANDTTKANLGIGAPEKRHFRPVEDAVRDHPSKNPLIRFVMSESGGLFLVAIFFFVSSLFYLIISTIGLFTSRFTTSGEVGVFIRGGIAIAFLCGSGLWIFTLGQDYLKPPRKAYGGIANRRAERKEVKEEGRSVGVEFYYTADFTPIDAPPDTPPILLRMNEAQYHASGKTRWAYVEYRAKSGFVSLYQAVQ